MVAHKSIHSQIRGGRPLACVTFSSMRPDQILPNLPRDSKLLFIRLRSLGDTVLSTPLYAALKTWRPDLQLDVLMESPHHEVLAGNPNLRRILSLGPWGNFAEVFFARSRILRALWKERYHACINLHGGSTSAWLTWLSKSPLRIGLSSFRNQLAYNIRLTPPRKGSGKYHTVEYFIDWLRQLGMPTGGIPDLQIEVDPASREEIQRTISGLGIGNRAKYCVIQPASKFGTKQWPANRFGTVAEFIDRNYGLRIILTGSQKETEILREIATSLSVPPIVMDDISIRHLAALLEGASLFIGNDSGPTHMAAALKVPLVVLFGSSDSGVWYPWHAPHELVQNPFDCNPCPGYKCLVYDEPRCILSISPEQVQSAISALLGGS
jgi:heptosyltransferase-3